TSIICSPMTSLKTSIKTITYLSDIGCLEIQGASLVGFGVVVDLHCQEAFWLHFWCFVRMFCGSFSLQAFLVVHVVFKSIHAVVAYFAAVCRIIFSFRDGLFRFNHS
ncbi:hypothetical protein ODS90_26750, partial [Escherichia coli]|nr:hypothetical protein [Escherichia coli]